MKKGEREEGREGGRGKNAHTYTYTYTYTYTHTHKHTLVTPRRERR